MELLANPLSQQAGKWLVIPAQAGIQSIKVSTRSVATSLLCPLRGLYFLAGFRPAPE